MPLQIILRTGFDFMSIPKVIHYCWFGGAPLPKSVKKCISSWRRYAPDYEIIRWDESNFDFSANVYAKQAYDAGKWAFVSDYARLKIIYENGGVYLDTDVRLIKSLNSLTEKYDGFFGYEAGERLISTGLGFGAAKGNRFVKALLEDYENIPFIKPDGEFDQTPCPQRNTQLLVKMGLDRQTHDSVIDNVAFLEEEVLCPINFFTGEKHITDKTISIHKFDASWCTDSTKRSLRLKKIIGIRLYCFLYAKILHKSNRWEW